MSSADNFAKYYPEDRQEGGEHYKMEIQPWEFITTNNLSYFQGNVIKYVVRYQKKNGIEDLNKIIHYCELEIKRLRDSWDKF
tara:strand:+ start:2776 stop:3021 length:246 start_codon:yes stop_codon:yes gene_type:complete